MKLFFWILIAFVESATCKSHKTSKNDVIQYHRDVRNLLSGSCNCERNTKHDAVVEILGHECHKREEKDIKLLNESASCTPRLTLVNIKHGLDSSLEMMPYMVEVKRCEGTCNINLKKCHSTQKEIIRFPVQITNRVAIDHNVFPLKPKETQCFIAEVEQHLECSCCSLTEISCIRMNPPRRLNPESCMCECEYKHYLNCMKLPGMVLDRETCLCKCKGHKCDLGERTHNIYPSQCTDKQEA